MTDKPKEQDEFERAMSDFVDKQYDEIEEYTSCCQVAAKNCGRWARDWCEDNYEMRKDLLKKSNDKLTAENKRLRERADALAERVEVHLKFFKETKHLDDYGYVDIFDSDQRIFLEDTLQNYKAYRAGGENL